MSFKDNTAQRRFEYETQGAVAFARYHLNATTLFIDYVEAPPALRGTGAAGDLMKHVMEEARQRKLKVTPICGYAVTWLSRHPEFADLRA